MKDPAQKTLLSLLLLITFSASSAKVITWPGPEARNSSSNFRVWVNGEELFVYDSPVASFASFDFDEAVEVKVKASRDLKWVDVRPLRLGIRPATGADSTFKFMLSEACKLSLEFNGEIDNNPLFLFAGKPELDIPDPEDPDVIYFKAGQVHNPGLIEVRSGQTIYLEGGAIVDGIIRGERVEDVTVRGRGILLGTNNRKYRTESRSRFIQFDECRNISIRGITLVDSKMWEIVPILCDGVEVKNVKIFSENGGDDGIDVVRSKNVHVSDCFIRTKDDCIAIKAAMDYPTEAGVENVLVENCVFWNSIWGNAIEIGFELRSDYVRNITFRNIDVIHCQDGAVMSIHNGDRATVENVLFEDIRVEDARQKLFDLAIFFTQYSVDYPRGQDRSLRYLHGAWDGVQHLASDEKMEHAGYRGKIRNVTFRNIEVVDGLFPFSVFTGYDDDHDIDGVIIDNLLVHNKKITSLEELKVYNEFTRNIELK